MTVYNNKNILSKENKNLHVIVH